MVAMSDFSTFSQMTYDDEPVSYRRGGEGKGEAGGAKGAWLTRRIDHRGGTHWDTVGVLLADALSLCLPLLEGVLVLELGAHG